VSPVWSIISARVVIGGTCSMHSILLIVDVGCRIQESLPLETERSDEVASLSMLSRLS